MGESLDIPADDPTVDPLAEALKRIAALERVVNKTAPVQPGLCVPWCGTAPVSLSGEQEPAPQWLLCNGAAVSQAKWPLLFAAIGAKFNQGGEGAGEFRLPDFTNGRCPVGKGASGTFVTVGVKGGAETRTLTTNELPAHNHPGSSASSTPSLSASHSLTAAAHSHTFDFGTQAVASGTAGTARTQLGTAATDTTDSAGPLSVSGSITISGSISTSLSIASQGSGAAFSVMGPYQVVEGWLIYAGPAQS